MRHGEVEECSKAVINKDCSLSTDGIYSVEQIAKWSSQIFKNTPVTIWASPYLRTMKTAMIVNSFLLSKGGRFTDTLMQDRWEIAVSSLIKEESPILLVRYQLYLQSYLMTMTFTAMKIVPAGIVILEYDVSWKQGKVIGYMTQNFLACQ